MKKIYVLALAALALTFSCVKNTAEQIVPEETVGKTVTVTCEFAQPDTKVAIDDSNGKTTWEEGDQISIHGKYFSKSVTVTLAAGDITDAGKTATFTVTLPTTPYPEENPEGYYAVYPASAAIANDASDHAYHYSTFSTSNLPLMAGYYTEATNKFTFFNLCGIMSFKVSGDYDCYEFEGKDGEVLGYGKYAVKITSSEQNYKHSTSADPLTMITGSVVSDGTTPNLICIPKKVEFEKGSGFVLYLLKDGLRQKKLVYTNTSDDPLVIAKNQYRPLGTSDIISYFTDATPSDNPTHNHGLTGTFKEDLSATASANCYIINAADGTNADKLFKFKAYKGNSSQNVGAIKSVDVLWETDNTATAVTKGDIIKEVAYDYQSGNTFFEIYLKTPATMKAGNAIIAAKDGAGQILWSWHIWIPATDVDIQEGTALCGAYIMDRNLGALVATASTGTADPLSIGLYYQWGRKDPFPGNSAFSGTTPISVVGQAMTKHNGLVSTAYSIQNPTHYAYVYGQDNSDWNEDHPTNLWEDSGKTIYDPCPPGYRVPVRNSSLPMWAATGDGWDTSVDNRFIYGLHVFPTAGYIDCWGGDYANVGVRSHVWSATNRDATRAYCLYNKSNVFTNSNFHKAKAGSVRCVAE